MIRPIFSPARPGTHGNGICLTPWVGVSVLQKPRRMRRVIKDTLLSACALAVLLVGMIAMDGQLREQVLLRTDPAVASTEVASQTAHAQRLATVAYQLVKEQADQHGPLMAMLLVGVGLMVIMFRT